jgi:hypothetical protein
MTAAVILWIAAYAGMTDCVAVGDSIGILIETEPPPCGLLPK